MNTQRLLRVRHSAVLMLIALFVVQLLASDTLQAGEAVADRPSVVINVAAREIGLGGDCNRPTIWLDGKMRVYESPYPQGEFNGGVNSYRTGDALDQLTQSFPVNPDRTKLLDPAKRAFGPWFESVVVDDKGVLWAYYHAEFLHQNNSKIHPRIGAQVSKDKGVTWTDLGIIIDTPEGTDQLDTALGYGFTGGNGDCSVVLDEAGKYLYFFFSQYGSGAEDQGIAVARMLWADRATPAGKVMKWNKGDWKEPGLGGHAQPFRHNVGDAHGKRGAQDFWWGPAVHYNTYLGCWVIMLNRSDNGGFSYKGQDDWYMTSTSLEDPTKWDEPRELPFPDGYEGSWYPQVIGSGPNETDKRAGQVARLFVAGVSKWEIQFLKPGEKAPNRLPKATGESYATMVGQPLVVPAATGVLANDTDPDRDKLTAVLVKAPASGKLTLAADGSFTYTPAAGFSGAMAFSYRCEDGQGGTATSGAIIEIGNPGGDGLQWEIFTGKEFTGKAVTGIDPVLNHDWGNGAPDPAIAPDGFCVRWTGAILPRFDGTYQLLLTSDDGIRVWVDGKQVIDSWADRGPTTDTAEVALKAGKRHAIRIEYFENSGGAMARFEWSSPSQPREVVPQARLFSK